MPKYNINKPINKYLNMKIVFAMDGGNVTAKNEEWTIPEISKELNSIVPAKIEIDELVLWDNENNGELYALFHGADNSFEGEESLAFVHIYFDLRKSTITKIDTEGID